MRLTEMCGRETVLVTGKSDALDRVGVRGGLGEEYDRGKSIIHFFQKDKCLLPHCQSGSNGDASTYGRCMVARTSPLGAPPAS